MEFHRICMLCVLVLLFEIRPCVNKVTLTVDKLYDGFWLHVELIPDTSFSGGFRILIQLNNPADLTVSDNQMPPLPSNINNLSFHTSRFWLYRRWQLGIWFSWMHDDIIKWKHFPRYWPFVWGIHRSPGTNSPHKGQWRGALVFSFIWA